MKALTHQLVTRQAAFASHVTWWRHVARQRKTPTSSQPASQPATGCQTQALTLMAFVALLCNYGIINSHLVNSHRRRRQRVTVAAETQFCTYAIKRHLTAYCTADPFTETRFDNTKRFATGHRLEHSNKNKNSFMAPVSGQRASVDYQIIKDLPSAFWRRWLDDRKCIRTINIRTPNIPNVRLWGIDPIWSRYGKQGWINKPWK